MSTEFSNSMTPEEVEAFNLENAALSERLAASAATIEGLNRIQHETEDRLAAALADVEALKASSLLALQDYQAKTLEFLATIKRLTDDLGVARSQVERFRTGFESQTRMHSEAVEAHKRTKAILEATDRKLTETAAKLPPETPA